MIGGLRRASWTRPVSRAAVLPCLALVGCTHSEPFVLADQELLGPFDVAAPIRLTYADGHSNLPVISQDGSAVVYSYSRAVGSSDADICLGVLPVGGGTRVATVCPDGAGDIEFRDGIEHGALSSDGTLVYTLHSGRTPPTNFTAVRGALWMARIDSVGGRHSILPLRSVPSGATASWDYLLDMHWSAPGELLALAVTVDYRGPNSSKDTVVFGHSIVRLRVDRSPLEWSHVASGLDAAQMTVDQSNGAIYLLVHTYADELVPRVIADTLLRLPITGGAPEVVFGWPNPDEPDDVEIVDIAARQGRVFAVRRSRAGNTFRNELVEISGTGQVTLIPSAFPGQVGRIAVSPDASFLIAEVTSLGTALYRMELP